jgi:hypothetical protein
MADRMIYWLFALVVLIILVVVLFKVLDHI